MKYDFLLVGAGIFSATFAHIAAQRGKKILVIEKRPHIGGNVYSEDHDGIHLHKYGAHIFHTGDRKVWDFVNRFAEFNRYTNSPLANCNGRLYNLPFNMNTFHAIWPDVITPDDAKKKIDSQTAPYRNGEARNLEEQALSLVGRDIYELLIKGYTEKQWGRKCTELPAAIIRRLPLRFTYDNNYFSDRFQGIPIGGYTAMIGKMLSGIEVRLNTDFLQHREELSALAEKIIYTGPIDGYFDYSLGQLEYRSLRFETERLETSNFQGNAVVNYTAVTPAYTRIIEHRHFDSDSSKDTAYTLVTREYPADWQPGDEPYYPVNNARNAGLYQQYQELAARDPKTIFGGRLGLYQYLDMDDTILAAMDLAERILN